MINSERYVGRLMILGGIIATAALPRRADLATNLMPVTDTGLFQHDPDNNLGGMTYGVADTINQGYNSRALFKFDVAGGWVNGAC